MGDDVCCICLDTFESSIASRLLTCKHRIHSTCLKEYIDRNYTTCPICRQSLDGHAPTTNAHHIIDHITNILSIIFLIIFGFFDQYIIDHILVYVFTIFQIIEYVIYMVFCSFFLYILLFFLAYISTPNNEDNDD